MLGEDLTQTGARMALSVRQAVKVKHVRWQPHKKWLIGNCCHHEYRSTGEYPLFVTHVDETRLDDVAAWSYRAPVVEQARLGFAIAHHILMVKPLRLMA